MMAAKRVEPRARGRPPNGAQGAKRALLVAVNHHGNPQNDLPSCLKDAAQFKSVLQSHYAFEDFTELYDADATATKVDTGLGWLWQDATEADRLVFFYSGHGYQQPRNGNLEECLVLGNLDFYFDDRLSRLSQSAPAGVLTVVLDSCFSGGMDKQILLGERMEIARTKLWVPPPDASHGKAFAAGPRVPRPFGCFPVKGQEAVKRHVLGSEVEPGAKGVQPTAPAADEAGQLQLNALLLSACGENETASAATSATKGMSAVRVHRRAQRRMTTGRVRPGSKMRPMGRMMRQMARRPQLPPPLPQAPLSRMTASLVSRSGSAPRLASLGRSHR
jgi:hypothetical protein